MSGLYLVLRTRLAEVKQWYSLGTDVMRDARDERGLSYEAMGRLLHVSGKTYERWEKRGQVPRSPVGMVERLADVLGLEIEHEPQVRRTIAIEDFEEATTLDPSALQRFEDAVMVFERGVGRLESVADRLEQGLPAARESQRSGR